MTRIESVKVRCISVGGVFKIQSSKVGSIFFVRLKRFLIISPSMIAESCKTAQDFVNGYGFSVQELSFVLQSRH